jgi:hypothetical protein
MHLPGVQLAGRLYAEIGLLHLRELAGVSAGLLNAPGLLRETPWLLRVITRLLREAPRLLWKVARWLSLLLCATERILRNRQT